MPEMNYSKKLRGWSLRDAADANQLLEVTCQLCRRTYRFFPRDLLKLTKDVSLDRLAGRFRCQLCDRREYMNLKVVQIWGSEIGKLPVRRLVKVTSVKKPIWEDGVL
ncbi:MULTISPECIES: hypothetical protein [Rhizobium]|uniref:hypothetical protein n=1 Tax=Rhizobium TaxID=379 RepID=UPI001B32B0D7|nr:MULTISPECIES: hypothetical protein [Rhizobium]MBX4908397.1 hypothetical protein [Rhizobium bangladeshense]MBX5214503.1 hypothetical protein [Rhizobium sp. NLR9a]MBX5233613.1 hypothetical protein [Rhizobium sp. NLR4a]MBX5245655.1 hypothetical protein [Rhizobium sp. NLR3b]MBX5251252.1 hypothetical protein [Rhizobium sp. NLR4b]